MVEFLDELGKGVVDIGSLLASATPIVIWIIIIFGIAFIGFVLVVHFSRKFGFAGSGSPIGHYNIMMMGKYPIEVNLAKWDEVDDRDLDYLERDEEKRFEFYADVARRMIGEDNLHVYTAKITDDDEVTGEQGDRTYFVSPVDLDDKLYYHESHNKKFTWRSVFQRNQKRFVVSAPPTDKVQVYNEDKNLDDWYFLVPYPSKVVPKDEIGYDSNVIPNYKYHISLQQITNPDRLAYAESYMPLIIKYKKMFDQITGEYKAVEEFADELSADNQSKQQKLMRLKRKLGTKEWVITSKKEKIREKTVNFALIVIGVVLGAVMPNFTRSYLQETQAFAVGVALAVGMIAIGYWFAYLRDKPPEDDDMVVEESK